MLWQGNENMALWRVHFNSPKPWVGAYRLCLVLPGVLRGQGDLPREYNLRLESVGLNSILTGTHMSRAFPSPSCSPWLARFAPYQPALRHPRGRGTFPNGGEEKGGGWCKGHINFPAAFFSLFLLPVPQDTLHASPWVSTPKHTCLINRNKVKLLLFCERKHHPLFFPPNEACGPQTILKA